MKLRSNFGVLSSAAVVAATLAPDVESAESVRVSLETFMAGPGNRTVTEVLSKRGLLSPQSPSAFARRNGGSTRLEARRKYFLPVTRVVGVDILGALGKMRVPNPERFFERIQAYNKKFNPEYEKSGVGVLVPDWGTGFYAQTVLAKGSPQQTGKTAVHEGAPDKHADSRTIIGGEARFESIQHLPYPDLKRLMLARNVDRTDGELSGYCFVLDPGHGGGDPGTHADIVRKRNPDDPKTWETYHAYEAPIVYDIALRLMAKLADTGALVYLTHYSTKAGARNIDYPGMLDTVFEGDGERVRALYEEHPQGHVAQRLSLMRRKRYAIRAASDQAICHGRKTLFFSLHADSNPGRKRNHFSIHIDAQRNLGAQETSKTFADNLAKAFGPSTSVREQGLMILRGSQVLGALIELGNVQNRAELVALLADKKGRQIVANRLAKGFIKAFGRSPRAD